MFFPDHAGLIAAPPNCADTSAGNVHAPFYWGVVIRDVDGSLASIPGYAVPGLSIVGNHPLLSVPSVEYPLQNSFARLSALRYGHVILRHPGISAASVPDVAIARLPNVWAQGTLSDPGTPVYLHCFRRFDHKQWPVIVESNFTYSLDFVQASSAPGQNHVTLTLDDVEATDTVYLVLENAGSSPSLAIPNAKQVISQAALTSATKTSYFVNGADVHLKFAGVNEELMLDVVW